MAIFFFVIGLEVKRELVSGELQSFSKAVLPLAGALGGMIVPAGIYLFFLSGQPGSTGWGIPMATDIAFVVGIMALLGTRIPAGLRVFLLSLAIADDIGAILVIAIGYTEQIGFGALLFSLAMIGVFRILQRLNIINTGVYILVGLLIWFGFHESGIHATLAGVILGLMTPASTMVGQSGFRRIAESVLSVMHGEGWPSRSERMRSLRDLETAARESVPALDRFENGLHPWVGFLIIPFFALANAALPLEAGYVTDPVALAVMAGLVIGKPVGIFLFSLVVVRAGFAELPENVRWGHLAGSGCLAGIGFTMALFISGLALEGAQLDAAKFGVFTGSILSAGLGVVILLMVSGKKSPDKAM